MGFSVKGHANGSSVDAEGHDLVCAAVSSLSISVANTVEEIYGCESRNVIVDDEGFLSMRLKEGIALGTGEEALRVFEIGIKGIQEAFPDNIEIHRKEV
jgi:uncharacterized protein YsxB (DUF464 family)